MGGKFRVAFCTSFRSEKKDLVRAILFCRRVILRDHLQILPKLCVARGPLQESPLQFQRGNARVKSWQPTSNSWSTSSQPDFVRALNRRKTARNHQGKILYTELLKLVISWSIPHQLLGSYFGSPTPTQNCRVCLLLKHLGLCFVQIFVHFCLACGGQGSLARF